MGAERRPETLRQRQRTVRLTTQHNTWVSCLHQLLLPSNPEVLSHSFGNLSLGLPNFTKERKKHYLYYPGPEINMCTDSQGDTLPILLGGLPYKCP